MAGVSLYPAHKTTNQWLNAAAFATPASGTWGNASRNAVRAPGIWQMDSGLEKQFPVWERMNLSFRADVFNVFNRDQIGSPQATWAPGSGTFGQITSPYTTNAVGTGTPRQMQFSLRLSY